MSSTNKKSSPASIKRPAAPPVYRPQQVPKVLQTKSALVAGPQADRQTRKPVAPPAYRPEVKKIVQPKAASLQRKTPKAPPVYRPGQEETAQPKTASIASKLPSARQRIAPVNLARKNQTPKPPNVRTSPGIANTATVQRKLSQPGKARTQNANSSVIQAARDKLQYPLNYVLLPDTGMEAYSQHVQMRTRHFFRVVLNAVLEMQRQKGTVRPGMFTDHAKAQEASGYRLGPQPESKLDAAHLMNTTLVPGAFPIKSESVGELYRSSAATTTQFQKANVGPDKRIDSQQTATKNAMLHAIQHGAVVDRKFIAAYVDDYLRNLTAALSVQLPEPEGVDTQARAAALRAVVEDGAKLDAVVEDIMRELRM